MSDEFAMPLTIIRPLCLIVSLTAFFPFLFSHFLLTEADVNGRVREKKRDGERERRILAKSPSLLETQRAWLIPGSNMATINQWEKELS